MRALRPHSTSTWRRGKCGFDERVSSSPGVSVSCPCEQDGHTRGKDVDQLGFSFINSSTRQWDARLLRKTPSPTCLTRKEVSRAINLHSEKSHPCARGKESRRERQSCAEKKRKPLGYPGVLCRETKLNRPRVSCRETRVAKELENLANLSHVCEKWRV